MVSEKYGKYEIIDAHAHIFPEKIATAATVNIGHFYDIPMNGCGLSKNLVESGDKIGVAKYLVCSTATTPQQTRHINEFIAGECKTHSSFYGFGTTHPDSDDLSPKAFKIYEIIEGELPLMIHCGDNRYDYSDPVRIANICKNFPKLKLQAAHMGGYQQWDTAEEVLPRRFENLRIDISSSMPFMSPEKAAERIRAFGIENAFFGVDFPMWNHDDELERFLACGFSEEENRLVLSENFKNFYNL